MSDLFRQKMYLPSKEWNKPLHEPDLYIPLIGQFQSMGGFCWRQRAQSVVPHVIFDGSGEIVTDGKRRMTVEAGDVYFFFPGQKIEYYDNRSTPWSYLWFPLLGKCAVWAASQCGVTPENPCLKGIASPELYSKLKKQCDSFHEYTLIDSMVSAWTFIASLTNKTVFQCADNPIATLAKRCAMVLDHPGFTSANVETISEIFGVNRSTLYRNFTKDCGVSPKQYLLEIRFTKACTLLRTTNQSIKEIAHGCGFSDANYFSKIFSKKYGVAPGEWRKKFRT